MKLREQTTFTAITIVMIAIAITLLAPSGAKATPDKERAIEALTAVRDMATWLALIQTGVLVALAHLYEKPEAGRRTTGQSWAATTFLFMGAGLFSAAWILSAIPSMMLRVGEGAVTDVLSANLYGWWVGKPVLNLIRLEVIVTMQHTYWVIGLLSFSVCVWKCKFEKGST